MIRTAFPPGEVFSAVEVWLQDELRIACLDADISSPQVLGLRFRKWRDAMRREGVDEHGALWTCLD